MIIFQVENLSRVKGKVEKERSQLQLEVDDISSQLEEVTKLKVNILLAKI